ncbi:MAG: Zn-dependent oxidoreductase, partial [Hyphomicrobiales bacterium]
EDGKIRAVLAKTFPLSRFHDAQREFMAKRFVGKLVVQPDDKWSPL